MSKFIKLLLNHHLFCVVFIIATMFLIELAWPYKERIRSDKIPFGLDVTEQLDQYVTELQEISTLLLV